MEAIRENNNIDPVNSLSVSAMIARIPVEQLRILRLSEEINHLSQSFSGAKLKVKDETIEAIIVKLINYAVTISFMFTQRVCRNDNIDEHAENIFAKCLKTMREKNHDYSGDNADDPMKNFNISAQVVGITPEQGILVRMVDKINRLGTAFSGAELKVKDETIEDTLGDLINYSAIVAFRHSQRSETK